MFSFLLWCLVYDVRTDLPVFRFAGGMERWHLVVLRHISVLFSYCQPRGKCTIVGWDFFEKIKIKIKTPRGHVLTGEFRWISAPGFMRYEIMVLIYRSIVKKNWSYVRRHCRFSYASLASHQNCDFKNKFIRSVTSFLGRFDKCSTRHVCQHTTAAYSFLVWRSITRYRYRGNHRPEHKPSWCSCSLPLFPGKIWLLLGRDVDLESWLQNSRTSMNHSVRSIPTAVLPFLTECLQADDEVLCAKIEEYYFMGVTDTKMATLLQDDFGLSKAPRYVTVFMVFICGLWSFFFLNPCNILF